MGVFRDVCQHNIPFRLCGLMFLCFSSFLWGCLWFSSYINTSQICPRLPLPLPGIVTKDVVLTDPVNELVLVLSARYAAYFRSWLPLESHSCQYCHAHIVILVRVVRNLVFITPSNALSSPPQVERTRNTSGRLGTRKDSIRLFYDSNFYVFPRIVRLFPCHILLISANSRWNL
jgi:hypothetical protein